MMLYTRHQLLVLLLLVGAAAAGLGIDHWRRARPDLAHRLETLDRSAPAPRPAEPARPRRASPPEPVDLNQATEDELTRLPGIGPALASRIVAARPFAAVEELQRVRGVRRATLERLRPLVVAREAETPF